MIFRNKEGQFIGKFYGETFRKDVRRSIHMLREPEAWAIDSEVVNTLRKLGTCKTILIIDKENWVNYQVPFKLFMDTAITIDRGHGEQKALPLVYWKFKLAVAGERLRKFTNEAYTLKINQQKGLK